MHGQSNMAKGDIARAIIRQVEAQVAKFVLVDTFWTPFWG